ncbi:MAG: hypothetical protein HUN04_11425 [Desulfobacter sp.]|nr:MAG: hypothetical protein HUN04_11425 [Desulfobacter sp.]
MGDEPKKASVKQSTRSDIARWVIMGSTAIIVVLALALILTSADKGGAAEKIFTMVIPMLGTWVGTVLAYYFSGENFDKASESMNQMVEHMKDARLGRVKAEDVMIPCDAMQVVILGPEEDGGTVNLSKDMLSLLTPKVTRIPIITGDGRIRYIIHQSMLYKFITEKSIAACGGDETFDIESLTLKDFLEFNTMESEVGNSFDCIPSGATLADAKAKMEALPGCQDVFITEDGTKAKPVLGWLTNIDIARHSKS